MHALLQAFFSICGQLAVEKAVSGGVRIWGCVSAVSCLILCRGCVKAVQPVKRAPCEATRREAGIVASVRVAVFWG
jgi:hypothetical protein